MSDSIFILWDERAANGDTDEANALCVAKLRARLVELLRTRNVPVKAYDNGNAGLCIGVEDDNAIVEAAGMPGRFRWALRTLIILVPEGESHE